MKRIVTIIVFVGFLLGGEQLTAKDTSSAIQGLIDSFSVGRGKCLSKRCVNGLGITEYEYGSIYRGKFKNGLRHGTGTLVDNMGTIVFTGVWEKGKLKDGYLIDGARVAYEILDYREFKLGTDKNGTIKRK